MADPLYRWGQIALQEGDAAQARALFEESLAIFGEFKRVFGQVCCLSGFAGLAALAGQDEHAARLFGANEALSRSLDIGMSDLSHQGYDPLVAAALERLEIGISDLSHQVYDPLVAAVRERLGEASFTTAWAEGRKMTLEQALESAQI
jgi:hypothetical protein